MGRQVSTEKWDPPMRPTQGGSRSAWMATGRDTVSAERKWEDGGSEPLKVGIVHQDCCEYGGVENGAGLERDPDMERGTVAGGSEVAAR